MHMQDFLIFLIVCTFYGEGIASSKKKNMHLDPDSQELPL